MKKASPEAFFIGISPVSRFSPTPHRSSPHNGFASLLWRTPSFALGIRPILRAVIHPHGLLDFRIEGRRHDLGDRLDWLKANVLLRFRSRISGVS